MVDWKKPIAVRCRDKKCTYPARLICSDRRGRLPYVVLVATGSEEALWCFEEDGTRPFADAQVINVPETRTVWRALLLLPRNSYVSMVCHKDRTTVEKDVQVLKSFGYLVIEDTHEYTFEVPTCAD